MLQQLRGRVDKWDYMKLKSFCTTKEMVTGLKCLPKNGRKSLPAIQDIYIYIYRERERERERDKRLIMRICRELKKPNSQNINDSVKK
jgi:hypothetical protein